MPADSSPLDGVQRGPGAHVSPLAPTLKRAALLGALGVAAVVLMALGLSLSGGRDAAFVAQQALVHTLADEGSHVRELAGAEEAYWLARAQWSARAWPALVALLVGVVGLIGVVGLVGRTGLGERLRSTGAGKDDLHSDVRNLRRLHSHVWVGLPVVCGMVAGAMWLLPPSAPMDSGAHADWLRAQSAWYFKRQALEDSLEREELEAFARWCLGSDDDWPVETCESPELTITQADAENILAGGWTAAMVAPERQRALLTFDEATGLLEARTKRRELADARWGTAVADGVMTAVVLLGSITLGLMFLLVLRRALLRRRWTVVLTLHAVTLHDTTFPTDDIIAVGRRGHRLFVALSDGRTVHSPALRDPELTELVGVLRAAMPNRTERRESERVQARMARDLSAIRTRK